MGGDLDNDINEQIWLDEHAWHDKPADGCPLCVRGLAPRYVDADGRLVGERHDGSWMTRGEWEDQQARFAAADVGEGDNDGPTAE